MNVFSALDNRTLLICDLAVASAFSVVLFAMNRSYPVLRGMRTVAIGFLLAVPGAVLLSSSRVLPYRVPVVVSYCFVLCSFVFMYRGILRFIGSRRTIVFPVIVSCVSLVVLFYFSEIDENVGVRILAISITIAIVRGLIALELLRKSPSFTSPKAMRFFAASMAFFAAASVHFGFSTIVSQTSSKSLDIAPYSATVLLLGIVSVCVTGLFLLVLSSGELIQRSQDESIKDSLSGALNRRGIEAKLQSELLLVQRSKHRLSIALIDLDYFKAINDIQGHAAGDAALRDIAEAISSHLRGHDYLGRYGGDEFLLILPDTPCNIALSVTERLNKAVTNLHLSAGISPLTLSIGITEAVPHDDAATLLARADKALYQAKSDGRNCRRVLKHSGQEQLLPDTVRSSVLVTAANSNTIQ
jgi:diguanylate cyclase (GGDEF)-like protein